MTVTVYKSTDSGAPVCNGLNTTIVPLLDALLVNGYGSGGTAKAAQGWSKVYVNGSTNVSYQMPASSNHFWLDVQDFGQYARVLGYETMTANQTGSGLFPTSAQITAGLYLLKSNTGDSTARPWFAYGNGKMLYLYIALDSSATNPIMGCLMFGDFTSYVPADTFNTIIIGGNTNNTVTQYNTTQNGQLTDVIATNLFNIPGHYIARAYTQLSSAVLCYKFTNCSLAGCTYGAATNKMMGYYGQFLNSGTPIQSALVYPNAADGGLYMERLWLGETSAIRGELPGIWVPLHSTPLAHLDTFQGVGALAGKTFECLRATSQTYGSACIFMETSNTW